MDGCLLVKCEMIAGSEALLNQLGIERIALLLAQAPAPAVAEPAAAPPVDPFTQFMGTMGLPLMVAVVVFLLIIVRPERKERQKRESLLANLKKNDRVQTIGGAIGTVADLSPDGKRVTLKFGDNTRIPFVRSSIQAVLTDEPETKSEAK